MDADFNTDAAIASLSKVITSPHSSELDKEWSKGIIEKLILEESGVDVSPKNGG